MSYRDDYAWSLECGPCPHRNITTVLVGSRRFIQGEPWDNIQERLLCLDCGDYVSEAEVRARWNGTDYFEDDLSEEEPDYGDF
jgi:hypothetical protein